MKIVIDADKPLSTRFNLGEILHFRDLLLTLAYRDLKVRYAQTFLGVVWTVLQPLVTMFLFLLVFNKALHVETAGVPYAVFVLSGLCSWSFFATVFTQAGASIINQQSMIQKIYFPRLILPLSKVLTAFVDLLIGLGLLMMIMIYYQFAPSVNIVFLPFFILLNALVALSAGIWMSALTVRFRDFQYLIPFLIQFGLYATPVAYPASLIPEKYHFIYSLNPMAGVIDGIRWSLLGTPAPAGALLWNTGLICILLITGLLYFKKVERTMADFI